MLGICSTSKEFIDVKSYEVVCDLEIARIEQLEIELIVIALVLECIQAKVSSSIVRITETRKRLATAVIALSGLKPRNTTAIIRIFRSLTIKSTNFLETTGKEKKSLNTGRTSASK